MKFRWSLAPPQPLLAAQLASALSIPPLLAQCLLNRGLSEPAAIAAFLQPRLKQLADPFLLPNMAAAVERLLQARQRNESLVIFGDYDVDGVTSTALLLEVLRALGWKVHHYLPHRMDEGYGLSQEARGELPGEIPRHLAPGRGLRLDRRGNHRFAATARRGRHRAGPSPGQLPRACRHGAGQSPTRSPGPWPSTPIQYSVFSSQ